MKTKLLIFVFLMTSFCLALPTISVNAAENLDSPVLSTELPSSSSLQREKRSIASNTDLSALASPTRGLTRGLESWDDPFFPGGGGEDSNSGNVGNNTPAPIGDVSLPVVFLAFFIYFVYRGLTISKRRSNF